MSDAPTPYDEELEQELRRIDAAFQQTLLPSVPWPSIVCDFMSQFRAQNFGFDGRFKPLVLDGPTRLGKSVFASQLFGSEQTLVLNCQNLTIPPLRRYAAKWHMIQAIVFEEADHRLVMSNKMLFQGSRELIELGLGPTEQHKYSVLMYFKAIIITSSNFMKDVSVADREYLDHNVLYLPVTDYLYQKDAGRNP